MKTRKMASTAMALSIIMLLAIIVGVVYVVGQAKCWYGHDYDDEGICERCGYVKPADEEDQPDEDKQQPDEGGMTEVEANSEGIAIRSRKIKRSAYADEGIATQAESAQQLTATVTPADATNKEVDWSVAWKNASSTWATGKTVTDYVTIAATSDGALTANLSCLQAFGEQVIVTVAVRDSTGIYATATVDYTQRVLSYELHIGNTWSSDSTKAPVSWSFKPASLTNTVDFPRMTSSVNSDFGRAWTAYYDDTATTTVTVLPSYSVGTISVSYQHAKISVAPSEAYVNALKAAGFTPKVSADNYAVVTSATNDFTVSDLLIGSLVSDSQAYFKNFSNYTEMRRILRENISSVMLNIKVEATGGTERDAATIYQVKFSANSVKSLVEQITINPGTITF